MRPLNSTFTLGSTVIITHLVSQQTNRLVKIIPRLTPAVRSSQTTGTFVRTTTRNLVPTALFLRNSTLHQLQTLVEIAAIDRLPHAHSEEDRFGVQYLLLSQRYNQRVVITISTTEIQPITSLAAPLLQQQKVFASAG
jgi:NADH:ubiquinone oxidoreductase subunit C